MKEDIFEKGAIIQRDKETYAVAPHIRLRQFGLPKSR